MKALIAFWQILKKDIDNYYLKPPNISWGIIFPLAWTLMQLIRSGGALQIKELLPGLMAMSVLFGTTSMLAVTITFERRARSFDRLLLAPVSLGTLILAKLAGAVVFGMANAFVPVAFAAFFISLEGIKWGIILAAVFLSAATSALLGLLIAVSAKEVFEAQTLANFFRFPMLFLCGLFVPLEQLPKILLPISFLLPLTYGADALRQAVIGSSLLKSSLSLSMLVLFTLFLYFLSLRSINRRWIL
ncbi:MAG TPA: ABC transporter permease [Firmicutes bacterium]|nr:ABC transporter permease [Bacillota bacterium]